MAMVIFVLFTRPITKLKVLWILVCVSACVWSFGLGSVLSAKTALQANQANIILHFGATFLPAFLFHFVSEITQLKKRWLLLIIYTICGGLIALAFTNHMATFEPWRKFLFYPRAKWGYHFFAAFLYLNFSSFAFILYRSLGKTNLLERNQILLLIVGISLAFTGGQMVVLPVYGIDIFPYGNIFVPLYVIFVSYGMMKYQLWDYKLALKKMSLIIFTYLVLFILALPFLLPIGKKMLSLPPEMVTQSFAGCLILSLILAAGPLIYAFLIQHGFWLKKNLAASLTHEFKTPLAAIQSASEILSQRVTEKGPSDSLMEYVEMIRKNAMRLDALTKNLLQLVVIQEGQLALEKSSGDIRKILEETISMCKPIADRKGIAITLKAYTVQPFFFDETKMRLILSNLLSNAVKYSDGGTIAVSLENQGFRVICSIKDEGSGIPQIHLVHIFERFFQGSRKGEGAGLGLAIAKAWVEAHGGEIHAESDGVGKGSRFWFSIPL